MLNGAAQFKDRPLPSLPNDHSKETFGGEGTPLGADAPPPLPPRKISTASNGPSLIKPSNSHSESLYHIPRQSADSNLSSYDSLTRLPLVKSTSRTSLSKIQFNSTSNPVEEYTSMTLKEVIDKYQHDFPLEVEVTAGYFGESEQDTFSEGDRLNFHFVKQVSVAIVETCFGSSVKIPLNSALQFSLLYNPNNNLKEASLGYMFKSVKELLAKKDQMPKVVCVTKQHSSSNATHSVEKGEILILDEVKHGRFGGQSLLCTSLRSNKQKRLSESVQGHFSTNPDDLKLFLPDIVKKLHLPLKALVVADTIPHDTGMTSQALFAMNEAVTIASVEKETTIIATPSFDENDDESSVMEDGKPIMFNIPVALKVMEVQIANPRNNTHIEKLYEDTRHLFESYDPMNEVQVGGKNEDLYYTSVRLDQRDAGVELVAPESLYSDRDTVLRERKGLASKEEASSKGSLSLEAKKVNGGGAMEAKKLSGSFPSLESRKLNGSFEVKKTTFNGSSPDLEMKMANGGSPKFIKRKPNGGSPKLESKRSSGASVEMESDYTVMHKRDSSQFDNSSDMSDTPLYVVSRMMENIQESSVLKELDDIKCILQLIQQQLQSKCKS